MPVPPTTGVTQPTPVVETNVVLGGVLKTTDAFAASVAAPLR